MSRNLFLDANIYLSFYLFGKDDLEEMAKVVKLIGDEEITLHTNTHLRAEIMRNRANKIAEGYSTLKQTNFGRELPRYCNDYSEHHEIRAKLKEVAKLHSQLVEKVQTDIDQNTLKADHLISGLLDLGTNIQISDEDVQCALRRVEISDPPGKRGSIGDAIHWLHLIKANPYNIDIVSLDADFSSPLDASKMHPYLKNEWSQGSEYKQVSLFRTLSDYFRERFPAVSLSSEFEKDDLVQRLIQSSSFAETHLVVSELSKYDSFTKGQIRSLFHALIENDQVGWIGEDDDVNKLFCSLKTQAWHLSENELPKAAALLGVTPDFFDLPF